MNMFIFIWGGCFEVWALQVMFWVMLTESYGVSVKYEIKIYLQLI